MSWEILGAVAGGLADAKRQHDQNKEMGEYRKAVKGYYDEQAEEIRSRRRRGRVDPMRSDIGAETGGVGAQPYARGGMIGHQDSQIEDWSCHGHSSDLWQKQSFKK